MTFRLHKRVRRGPAFHGVTPGMVVGAARICVPGIAAWVLWVWLGGGLRAGDAGQCALGLGLAVLLAAPRHRAAELLGAVAIWLTLCEFLAAIGTGQFALWRWAVMLAALAMVVVMTQVQHVRGLARANPWQPLRTSGRRADYAPASCAIVEGQAALIEPPSSLSA